jgi:phosphatidylethanolamine-binding protein (PEBP) family uncharacterized protein
VLLCQDLDALEGSRNHWVVTAIPATPEVEAHRIATGTLVGLFAR